MISGARPEPLTPTEKTVLRWIALFVALVVVWALWG